MLAKKTDSRLGLERKTTPPFRIVEAWVDEEGRLELLLSIALDDPPAAGELARLRLDDGGPRLVRRVLLQPA